MTGVRTKSGTTTVPGSVDSSIPPGAAQWLTLRHCKQVLAVVHTEVYGQRLRDVLSLLESDLRIQVRFTVAPHAFNAGAGRSLPAVGGALLPWEEAVGRRFDLVIAAGSQGMDRLTGGCAPHAV
ncbi:hypothetical protein ACFV2H_26475 [Streptomyces sp. NPDC059629]|uniref:hypothetical protein n=1 Tax=Streptomyces sp. NPDC059629 TaxID=3346889 RepID=UPI0036B0B5BA